MNEPNKYEVVVGLEVHAQLKTRSKLFCGDSTAFGAEPNTQVSPITLAHPGTLPKMNRLAVTHAIKMQITHIHFKGISSTKYMAALPFREFCSCFLFFIIFLIVFLFSSDILFFSGVGFVIKLS